MGIGGRDYLYGELGCSTLLLMKKAKGAIDPVDLINSEKVEGPACSASISRRPSSEVSGSSYRIGGARQVGKIILSLVKTPRL